MILVVWIYLIGLVDYGFGGSTLGPSEIAELADSLERDVPGSVDMFLRWSLMERSLDRMANVFHCRIPPPRGLDDLIPMAFFTLSTNLDMSEFEFQSHLFGIFNRTNLVTHGWRDSIVNGLTVPSWFFSELLFCKNSDWKYEKAVARMNQVCKKRFGDRAPSNSAIAHISLMWWLFGITTHPGYTARLDPQRLMWTMTPEAKKLALQHMAIVSITRKYTLT